MPRGRTDIQRGEQGSCHLPLVNALGSTQSIKVLHSYFYVLCHRFSQRIPVLQYSPSRCKAPSEAAVLSACRAPHSAQ